jgi:hypothetical protein
MPYLTIIGGRSTVAVFVDDYEPTDRGHRLTLDGHRPIMLPMDWTFGIPGRSTDEKRLRTAAISFEDLRTWIADRR